MNAFETLSSQPWVQRLGWTLVHFLWQGSSLAVLYAGARKAAAACCSNTRYLLACSALAAMLAAPLLTWSLMAPDAVPGVPYRIGSIPAAHTAPAVTGALPDALRAAASGIQPVHFLQWVVMLWSLGVIAFWARLTGAWVVASRARSVQVRPAPPEWEQTLCNLASRIGLSRPVRLLVSAMAQGPSVVGWLRPVVLVPVGALSGLPPEHLEALLAHELAHIRRHDYLVNIVQSIAEALLFYHPAVWWVSGQIRDAREQCCDDVAVSVSGDVLLYASALAELESYRAAPLAIAANSGSLPDRIARLLGRSRPPAPAAIGPGLLTIAILLLGAAYGLFGQSGARPVFQAASIKRNPSVGPRVMFVRPQPGGRLTAGNAPLMLLIQNAYQVQAFQISGGPSWINSDAYDLEAKPEGNTDRPRMWLMLQSLLADRFKLALHRETRQLQVYALTVTRSGLKQEQGKEEPCVSLPPDAPLPPPPGPGQPGLCGYVNVAMTGSGLRLLGGKVPMAELVRTLAMVMGRPVIDRTGITALLNVHLVFTPDENTGGLPGSGGPGDPGGPRLPTDPSVPNILAALPEQLGLKLDSARGPVEVLVIDHVERPSAN